MIQLGVKSDPIQYRYSYDWLFDVLHDLGIPYLQLGSFFELYFLEDRFFYELREKAEQKNVRIKSCFTAHRELGGFLAGDPYFEKVARRCYEWYIRIGGLLGVDYLGSNMGAVYRDQMDIKAEGIERYIRHMQELVMLAKDHGIQALTIEPMSCTAEPPSFPKEILSMMETFDAYHKQYPSTTVPLYLCGDISHGIADQHGKVVHSNLELFELAIPYMVEFHFKNTDEIFHSTFGFSPQEIRKGIIHLEEIKEMITRNAEKWPVDDIVGYLELSGPKLGRDYSDYRLGQALTESLMTLKRVFE